MLVAFEETYRCYSNAIATSLWAAFPGVETDSVDAGALASAMVSFRPDLVLSNLSETENSRDFAWVELSSEPTEESRMRVGNANGTRSTPASRN